MSKRFFLTWLFFWTWFFDHRLGHLNQNRTYSRWAVTVLERVIGKLDNLAKLFDHDAKGNVLPFPAECHTARGNRQERAARIEQLPSMVNVFHVLPIFKGRIHHD